MRVDDHPTVDVEIRVDAPPDRVWALVCDLGRMGEWSPENLGGSWLDGAQGPGPGARFRGRNRHEAIGEWETVAVVERFDEGRVLGWRIGEDPRPGARWSFEIVPDGDGCLLRQHFELGGGPTGLTPAIERMPDKEERIVARRIQEHDANMRATLAGIKRAAESPA